MNRYIKIGIFCIIAALLNIFSATFFRNFLNLTLFVDTIFTAAITFSFGLIPGITTAVLSWGFPCIYWKDINLFILCSFIEVLIIYALKPKTAEPPPYALVAEGNGKIISSRAPTTGRHASRERIIASYIGIAAKLMLIYFVCMITVSITGGIIDYISQIIIDTHVQYYHIENTYKLALIMNNLPILAVNILSRVPINIVDRFIVIFGGYLISRALVKIVK